MLDGAWLQAASVFELLCGTAMGSSAGQSLLLLRGQVRLHGLDLRLGLHDGLLDHGLHVVHVQVVIGHTQQLRDVLLGVVSHFLVVSVLQPSIRGVWIVDVSIVVDSSVTDVFVAVLVNRPTPLGIILARVMASVSVFLRVRRVGLVELFVESSFEVPEGEEDDGDVVQRLVSDTVLHDTLHYVATNLVHGLVFLFVVLLGGDPGLLDNLGVSNLVENAVTYSLQKGQNHKSVLTSKQQKVHLVVDHELFDVWVVDDHVRVAAVLLTFGLDVAEGSGDGESAWKHPIRSIDDVRIRDVVWPLEVADLGVVLARLVSDSLHTPIGVILSDSLRLIHSSSVFKDSFLFDVVVGLVVEGQVVAEVPAVGAHDGSAVSYVDTEDAFFDEEGDDGTGPTPIQHMLPPRREALNRIQEVVFSLLVAIENSLSGIFGKLLVLDDELMQVVSQEVGTGVATVTVKDAEEGALWPMLNVLLLRWLHDVQDDAYSVFVVVTDDALVGVGCIPHNTSIFSDTALSGLPSWQVQTFRIRRWSVSQQQSLNIQLLRF